MTDFSCIHEKLLDKPRGMCYHNPCKKVKDMAMLPYDTVRCSAVRCAFLTDDHMVFFVAKNQHLIMKNMKKGWYKKWKIYCM